MDEALTLDEVGRRLGVTRRRAQAMVSSGVLPAERRGVQWFVPAAAVRAAKHNRDARQGRPLAARTVWAHTERLAGDGLRLAATGQLDDIRKRLRRRADHRGYYVHPGLVPYLRDHPDVVLGGRDAAAGAGLPVDPIDLDLYVPANLADPLFVEFAAKPASEQANVFAHVVPYEVWPFHPGQRHVDLWVAWLDLEDRQDRGALTVLDRLIGGRPRA